ncbi:hypothetical protein A2U01_0102904, partial [Trifolium medium]|nr:hypothetical protein [Trifolium medium]
EAWGGEKLPDKYTYPRPAVNEVQWSDGRINAFWVTGYIVINWYRFLYKLKPKYFKFTHQRCFYRPGDFIGVY